LVVVGKEWKMGENRCRGWMAATKARSQWANTTVALLLQNASVCILFYSSLFYFSALNLQK